MNTLSIILMILFFSTIIQSTFSFGGALLALPLLAFALDIKTATPLITLLASSIAIIIVLRRWRDIHFQDTWRLVLSACLGIPLGILFLGKFDGRVLKIVLALTVISFTVLDLLMLKALRLPHKNYAFIFGFISGLAGGAYNISGPPVVLYGTLAKWQPDRFRATLQCYGLFTNVFAIVGYYLAGNITPMVVSYYGYALPIVGVSVWLGNIFHKAIPGEKYQKYIKFLLLLLGANLLYTAVR